MQANMERGIKRNYIEYYCVRILAERSKELTDSITGYHNNSLINYPPLKSIMYCEMIVSHAACNRCNYKQNHKLDENMRTRE